MQWVSGGYSSFAVFGLLITAGLLVAEDGLWGAQVMKCGAQAQWLVVLRTPEHVGSIITANEP